MLKETFEKIEKYLLDVQNSSNYLTQNHSPSELLEKMDFSIQNAGNNNILPFIDKYLEHSVKTGSKHFYNQLFGGFNLPAIIGEFITAITNTSMYTYEVAPVATLIEKELIKEFCDIIGYKNNEGIFVTGGSNSNLIAMLSALNQRDKQYKFNGKSSNNHVLFISEDSHYSYDKAAIILGIGLKNVKKIKTDSNGAMIPSKLEKQIQKEIELKNTPFFVGLTAGTTVKGAFDPINEIVSVCKKYNLWVHVDGSWGGPLLYSQSKRNLLNGCETVDSFSIDAHKMLGVPLICSAIMFKQSGVLYNLNNISGMDYLLRDEDDINYNLGNFSLQCGRRVDALKLWLTYKNFGRVGIKNRIEGLVTLANYTGNKLKQEENFKLISPLISLNICFQYVRAEESDDITNKRTDLIRSQLMANTKYLINTVKIKNKKCFRLIIVNPQLTTEDIDHLINTIKDIAINYPSN